MASASPFDVVIVGGGVAGSALASVLSRSGKSVLVLERSEVYVDRVRGEYIQPWGVAEVQRLGLLDALIQAGANFHTRYVPYDDTLSPEEAEAATIALEKVIPGIPGTIGLAHPAACEGLASKAREDGAVYVRGVRNIDLGLTPSAYVKYDSDGRTQTVSCRLVIGADGRESTVRRLVGRQLNATQPRLLGAGLLIQDMHGWPAEQVSIGTDGDLVFFVLPQHQDKARIYLMFSPQQKGRFAGPNAARDFLSSFPLPNVPRSEAIARARPAGPCATFPMNDTWTDNPVGKGFALIGDAAGYPDPHFGQGLSAAMRDVRVLSELLLTGNDWSPSALVPYVDERAELMRRLRFCNDLSTTFRGEFGPQARDRRRLARQRMAIEPELGLWRTAALAGPETVPSSAFDPSIAARLFAPAQAL